MNGPSMTPWFRKFAISCALLSTSEIACNHSDDEYQTEYSIITSNLERPPCAADLAQIDEQFKYAEAALGLRATRPVEIHLYDGEDIRTFCESTVAGCYSRDLNRIDATWQAINHEIVHAVMRNHPRLPTFWEEGVAQAVSRRRTERSSIPMAVDDIFSAQAPVNYKEAGHFVRWLLESYENGAQKVRDLSNDRELPFSEVYGLSADELVQDYHDLAPFSYPPLPVCGLNAPFIEQIDANEWREELAVSCEADASQVWSRRGIGSVRRIALAEGSYAISFGSDSAPSSVWIMGCQTEVLFSPPSHYMNGDVPNEAEQEPPVRLSDDMDHSLSLTTGVYLVIIETDTYDTIDFSISITKDDNLP